MAALSDPARITIGEWEQHRGELARTSSQVAAVAPLTREVNALSGNVALLRGEVRGLRDELRDHRKGLAKVREDSSSDLRVELERYRAEERQRELSSYRAAAKARRKWIFDVLKLIAVGLAGGVLSKLLHL